MRVEHEARVVRAAHLQPLGVIRGIKGVMCEFTWARLRGLPRSLFVHPELWKELIALKEGRG